MNSIKDTFLELQYQYSKLLVLSIPRRNFSYTISENSFTASNTSRNTIIAIVFTAFASLSLVAGLIELYKAKSEIDIKFILPFLALFPLIGIFALRQFLWLTNGIEILTIENNIATISKKGTFWVKSHSYELKYVDFIIEEVNDNMSLYDKIQFNIRLNNRLIFNMTLGQISFNYKNRNILFFSNLHKNESLLVVDQFRKMKQISL